MAPSHPTARAEREKKVKSVCSFASKLLDRLNASLDGALVEDLQAQILGLPLPQSPATVAKQVELEKLGTELWNASTRLRRGLSQMSDRSADEVSRKSHTLGLLRVFSFLLLDAAGSQSVKGREGKNCFRLMKIAHKAAKWCIQAKEVGNATKVLERAAEYQEISGQEDEVELTEFGLGERLQVEYFALRTALAWRSGRMDTAEHMFAKCRELSHSFTATLTELVADLLYDMGKDFLTKHDYEATTLWLERAHDILEKPGPKALSAEAGELRLSIMQSIVLANMKLNSPEAHTKAWHMLQLLEAGHEEKMSIALLKLELLYSEASLDCDQIYQVLHELLRYVVLNDRNFKTIIYYISRLKDQNDDIACKVSDELIRTRLFREENNAWVEKAVIMRTWITCTTLVMEGKLSQLRELLDEVAKNTKAPFSAQATHAAQTLLWKQVEAQCSQERHEEAEAWCSICLHSLFDMAGETNKSKIARKSIMCALARGDYEAARLVFSMMSEIGREDRVTRYLMYKVALRSGQPELAAECLESICRQSLKDTSILYACVVEAQQSKNKRDGIAALEKMLENCNDHTPPGVHLPALLRMTVRLLASELVKDSAIQKDVYEQLCKTFECALVHTRASRRRPTTTSRELFHTAEIEWFSKNSYNLAIKHCSEIPPTNLVQLLTVCIEFVKILQAQSCQNTRDHDFQVRLLYCHYLTVCAFTSLARTESNIHHCVQYYGNVSKNSKEFRLLGAESINELKGSLKAEMIAKHLQIIKLELEAVLKLEQWEEIEGLFEESWRFGEPTQYGSLADLALIIYSSISNASVESKYQIKVLCALQKIINASGKIAGLDIIKMARWIRCLFQLALSHDETVSLKCLDHATRLASLRKGETNQYPPTELEWLATTAFNVAVDFYVQEKDEKCKEWAGKALTLADWADGNALRNALMDKYNGLTWG